MLSMIITALPVILGSIINTFFLKTHLFQVINKPIDNNIILKDGKRLFGQNKTWRGFWGMVFFSSICVMLWGLLGKLIPDIQNNNLLYTNYENSFLYNIAIGGLLGLAYGIFELPNSFLKRRVGIQPGKSRISALGIIFVIYDQIDSLFGCVLVISFVHPMSIVYYFSYVFLGGGIHISMSYVFYLLKLRKNF